MNNQLYNLLVRSLDAALNDNEHAQVEQALAVPANKVEYRRLVAMRDMIKEATASAFKPFFVRRVLRRILSSQEEFRRWLLLDFRRVALIGAIIAILLACYNVSKHDSISIAAAFAQPDYTLEQVLRLEVPLQ